VALANLDLMDGMGLVEEASRLEFTMAEVLGGLEDHPLVQEVRRGTGALAAVQLEDTTLALPLAKLLRRHGLATRAVGAGAIQVSPPLVMTDAQVGELAERMRAGLDDLANRR
jgi:adenosylmethionine-8-amino-7-oxononanoate aminotransferase